MNITALQNSVSGSSLIFKLFFITLILIFTILMSNVIKIYVRRSFKEKIAKEHLDLLLKVIYYSTIFIILVIIIPYIFKVDLSNLLVAGGIVGIVIGFASQSIVSNLISGIFLVIERPVKVGNQVNIDGNSGVIEDISVMSTVIRTYDGLYVRIPNEKVFTTVITNYVANIARRFQYVVGIRYSDDADKAIKIIEDIIDEHPFALKNPEPKIFVDNLGDNAVNIFVRIWAPSTDWYDVKMELLWIIKKTLEENGIEIAFPQRTVWFANELKQEYTD
jgi:small-conductance mechanosensitive channel